MIYLDSAATSLLKPPSVEREMLRALRTCASPGRGAHAPAMRAAETVYACRQAAAALFHVSDPENIVFTVNATHALNIAVFSLVGKGSRVAVSGYEHNAVIRPLHALGAVIDVVEAPSFDTGAILDGFRRKIPGADAVVCTHVSNVFGYILPIEEIASICAQEGVPLIVDASQSAGHLKVDFDALGAEFIAMPGHKGLMGPQGTGILLCRNGGEPLMYGGTGSMSKSADMPDLLPDRLEAGTANVCGIAGLKAGIEYILKNGIESLRRRETMLSDALAEGLEKTEGLAVLRPEGPNRTGVVSVLPASMSCEDLAGRLGNRGVAVRSGYHCAPLAHRTAGTDDTGTVRFSVSPFNTPGEIRRALEITEKCLNNNYKM